MEMKIWHKIGLSCLAVIFVIVVVTVTSKASITYNAGSNTIIVVGGNETNPYTFEDIYLTDQSNGWGKISKPAEHTYIVDCFIKIGDGSTETWFADENKQVNFRAEKFCTGNGQKIFLATYHTHVRFGRVIDESIKATGDGCQFIIQNDIPYWLNFLFCYGQLELYSTSIILTDRHDIMGACLSTTYDSRIWNCMFENSFHFSFTRRTDIFNLVVIHGSTFLRRPDATTTVNYCIGLSCTKGIWFQGMGGKVKDVYARGTSYAFYVSDLDENDDDCYIINGDFDSWYSRWKNVIPERKVFRQYTVKLKIIDREGNPIENASIKIYDNNGTLIVNETTDENGEIPEQTITYGYYQRSTDGYYTHDEIFHSYSPHKIVIEKEGYQSVIFNLTIDRKIDNVIALNESVENISKIITLSGDLLIWIIPCTTIFLTAMTRRSILVIMALILGAFSFLYLTYMTGNFIYILASVVCLACSSVLSYEHLAGGEG